MHNALQGAAQDLDSEQWATWKRFNEMNARELSDGWDVCLIHDPQPAGLFNLGPEKAKGWVWRGRPGPSAAHPETDPRGMPSVWKSPDGHVPLGVFVPRGGQGGAKRRG